MEEFDASKPLVQNIRDAVVDPSCYLFEEPRNLLMQELRSPSVYNDVVAAIASGASKMGEIASQAHVDAARCAYYLRELAELSIVTRELPFGEESTKKTIWKIDDPFFRFWYRFVPSNYSLANAGLLDVVAERIVAAFSEFMGPVFERMCTDWLWSRNGIDLPVLMTSSARWWGTDPRTRTQEELDIVGAADGSPVLFAACKWRNEPMGTAELDRLVHRASLFSAAYRYPAAERHYYLFSKSGFTDELVAKTRAQGAVHLVDLAQMDAW